MTGSTSSTTLEVENSKDLSPKILLADVEAHREEWLALRRNKVSASNVAVICGISPFKSPLELWAEWTGKVQNTFKGNKATQVGLALEPLVASWWSERTGLGVTKSDSLLLDCELPWLVCSPDYIIDGGDPLEIKTGTYRQAHKWGEGRAPYEYVLQVQIQLRVMRREKGVLTAFLGDFENMPDVLIDYDPELFAMVREKAEEFIDCVKHDIPPAAGAGDAELLRVITEREEGAVKTFDETEGNLVAFLTAQAKEAAETAAIIRKELEKVDKQKKELENRIKQALGTNTVGKLPDGRIIKLTTVHVGEKTVPSYAYDRLSLPKN